MSTVVLLPAYARRRQADYSRSIFSVLDVGNSASIVGSSTIETILHATVCTSLRAFNNRFPKTQPYCLRKEDLPVSHAAEPVRGGDDYTSNVDRLQARRSSIVTCARPGPA